MVLMELALENPFTILYMGSMSNLNGCRCVFPRSLGKPHQTISDQCRIVQDSYIASKCTLSSYCVYGLDSRRASLLRDSSRVKLMDPFQELIECVVCVTDNQNWAMLWVVTMGSVIVPVPLVM
jgi:hypothetical protein